MSCSNAIRALTQFCGSVLYHLTQPKDRLTALHEGGRILRGGGLLWGAGISRFTSLLDSLSSGFFNQPEFVPIVSVRS